MADPKKSSDPSQVPAVTAQDLDDLAEASGKPVAIEDKDTGPISSSPASQASMEMRLLRQSMAHQGQLLAVMHDMIAKLEAQQVQSEQRLNDRLDGIHTDIAAIKTSLNGYFKP